MTPFEQLREVLTDQHKNKISIYEMKDGKVRVHYAFGEAQIVEKHFAGPPKSGSHAPCLKEISEWIKNPPQDESAAA